MKKSIILLLCLLPIIGYSAMPNSDERCQPYLDPELQSTFAQQTLTTNLLRAGYILSRAHPQVYQCNLSRAQHDQVCDWMLVESGLSREMMQEDSDLATRVKNAYPFMYFCALEPDAFTEKVLASTPAQ